MLSPLSREASKRLVTRLLGGGELSALAAGLVLDRAEGNPLFLEEVTRSLVESGTLVRGDEGWTPGDTHDADIPTTLHATLLARLDRLAEVTPWEALAEHYAHAEQWPQAQAAAVSAAERAERLHAYHEAATHWQRAWQASEAQLDTVRPGERADYAERQGNALSQLGEYDQ